MNKFSKYFDHTCLKPYATREDMAKICEEAKKYNFMMVGSYQFCTDKIMQRTFKRN